MQEKQSNPEHDHLHIVSCEEACWLFMGEGAEPDWSEQIHLAPDWLSQTYSKCISCHTGLVLYVKHITSFCPFIELFDVKESHFSGFQELLNICSHFWRAFHMA